MNLSFNTQIADTYTSASQKARVLTENWVLGIAIIGGLIFYRGQSFSGIPFIHAVIAFVLIVNGYFLSFKVSPFLLKREQEGRSGELLPASWQKKIMAGLIVSDIGWWGGLLLLVVYLLYR